MYETFPSRCRHCECFCRLFASVSVDGDEAVTRAFPVEIEIHIKFVPSTLSDSLVYPIGRLSSRSFQMREMGEKTGFLLSERR
jgi:hypothetical protein